LRAAVQECKFLEMLWAATFEDWRVEGLDPDAYELLAALVGG
jgi:hypothetical protein